MHTVYDTKFNVFERRDAGIELQFIQAIFCVASQNDALPCSQYTLLPRRGAMRRGATRYVNCELLVYRINSGPGHAHKGSKTSHNRRNVNLTRSVVNRSCC